MRRLSIVLTMMALPAAVTSSALGSPRDQTLLDSSGAGAGRTAGTLVRRGSSTVFFSHREVLHAASEKALFGPARRADSMKPAGHRHQARLLQDTEALPPNPSDVRDSPAVQAQVGASTPNFAGTTPRRPPAPAAKSLPRHGAASRRPVPPSDTGRRKQR